MKKRIKKESNNIKIIVDIIFNIVVIVLGYILVDYENFNVKYDYMLISSVFFIIAFLSSIAYFMTRKKGVFEYLLFCFINMLAGSFIYFAHYIGFSFIIGDALLVYALAIIVNKFNTARVLLKYKNTNFIMKFANGVMLLFISVFAIYSLYTKEEASNMIVGYYLMGVGLLNLLEPLVYVILSNPNVDKLLISILKYKEYENATVKKPRAITKKRIKKVTS